jgi:hypothetical protein
VIGDRVIPHDLAGAGIETDDVGIGRIDEDLVAEKRERAHRPLGHVLAVIFAREVPQEIAACRIERLHAPARLRDVHHAVMDEGCRFGGARRHRPGPGEL